MTEPLDLAPIQARTAAAEDGWHLVPDLDDPYRIEIHGDGPTHIAVFGGDHDNGFASYPTRENAEFAAHARQDVPALLAEVTRLRAELATAREEAAAFDPLVVQHCAKGVHPGWLVDSEDAIACPWCLIAEQQDALAARPGCPDPIECDHEAELGQLRSTLTDLRTEVDRTKEVLKATRAIAAEDPPTCESCGHLESAHDPNGDRDCHASGARVRQCTCTWFIPCYPAPVAGSAG